MDDSDPAARPTRRRFTAAEKHAYLDAYDALPKGSAERGAFLRREGLYSSHLSEWRKQRDTGALAGLAAKPRADKRPAGNVELDRSRRQVARLEAELERTKMALAIMGKAVGGRWRPLLWHEIVVGPPVDVDSDWRSSSP